MKSQLEKLQAFLSTHIPFVTWDYEGYENNDKLYNMQQDWNQTLITKINQTSATIFKESMKGGANVILIPDTLKEIFKTLEYFSPLVEDNYRFGTVSGRYVVYAIPDLTKKSIEMYDNTNQLKMVEFHEDKVFVCKLKNTNKIFDFKNYDKIGVVKVSRNVKLFD
jgi:hypothetical protein